MLSTKLPDPWYKWNKSEYFGTLQKGQRKVMVKTIGPVHNYNILANCWSHDWRSMSNSLVSYGVHKVILIYDTMWKISKDKGQRKVKVKTIGLVHNFIILANCWNHDRR